MSNKELDTIENNLKPILPPHNNEAEKSVIGAIMIDNDHAAIACRKLDHNDFYQKHNQKIFEAIENLYRRNAAIDPVTIIAELVSIGVDTVAINIEDHLKDILNTVPTAAHIKEYINIVKADAQKRELYNKAKQIQEECLKDDAKIEDIITSASNDLLGTIDRISNGNEPKNNIVSNYFENFLIDDMEKFVISSKRKTGFNNLDQIIGGINTGLYVIGAISSLGKTTFISQIADQMAAAGNHVLYFSMEQSKLEMFSKSIARTSAKQDIRNAITSLMYRQGRMWDSDIKEETKNNVSGAVENYLNSIGNRLSIIEGNFDCTVNYISNYVRYYKENYKAKPIVIVDYLQILHSDLKRVSIKELIDNNVTELKRLSRREDITVIVISSVNRNNYLAPIDFESFKESGGIEYTADVVWGLQLQALNEPLFKEEKKGIEKRERINKAKSENPRKIQLVCLKNRYGISYYTADFKYYPQFDLFVEDTGFNKSSEPTPFD